MQGITEGTLLGGRYELEVLLAHRGEDLEYWSARDTTLERDVALTCLLAEGPYSDAAQAALDGARRCASVDDARLVRVLDVGTSRGDDSSGGRGAMVSYVVEESLGDAEALADLVADGPLPPEEARRLVGEAAAALDVAGKRGLHHQQLTPYALLRTPSGAVKLSGVATAAVLDQVEEVSADDASRLDTEDLVALLYTGLTGRWPGVELPDLRPAVIKGGGPVPPVSLAPDVPGDLDALCREVLRRDSGPVTPGELARRLAPWSADEVTPERPFTQPPAPGPGGPGDDGPTDDTDDLGSALTGASAAGAAGAVSAGSAPDGAGDRDDVDETDEQPGEDDFQDPWADGELPPPAPAAEREQGPGASAPATSGGGRAALGAGAALGGAGAASAQPADPDTGLVLGAVDEAAEDEGERREPAGASSGSGLRTGAIFGLLLALLLVAGFLGFQAVRGLFGGEEPEPPAADPPAAEDVPAPGDGATTSPPAEPTEEPEPDGEPIEVASVTSYDPQGDGDERNDLTDNVLDGDNDTAWNTRRYFSLPWGGIKDGVGLELDLGESTPVSEVDVVFDNEQFLGEVAGSVYVGDEPDLEQMQEIGSTQGSRGTWTVTAEEPTSGRYVIVWFLQPGTNDQGEGYLAVEEIEVR